MRVTWSEASLALVLILVRTYTNAVFVKAFKWDYFWALLALVTGIIAQAILTVGATSGLGTHLRLLEPWQLVKALKYSWIAQILGIQMNGFAKNAVIAFLLRIQDRAQSRKMTFLTYFLYFIGISNFAVNTTEMSMVLTSCSPTEKFWNPVLAGNCNHVSRTYHVGYFQGSWVATSDILLAAYPILVFWNLKISARVKVGLCLLMAGGLLAAVAGFIKTVAISRINVEVDGTYSTAPLIIWAFTEHWLVLILGTLPTLRPLFVHVFRQVSSKNSWPHNSKHGYVQQSDSRSIPLRPHAGKRKNEDTESEINILAPAAGIIRTTQVQVVSASKDS
ncbi:hypothetical protein ACLMJK_005419 [Lecanora helva]